MDEIEAKFTLPNAADPLNSYARFYANDGQGRVIGVYVIPPATVSADVQCEELNEDLTSRPVPCAPLPEPGWANVEAGQRRWVQHHREVPTILDGGCTVVNVLFDKAKKVERVFCNGVG